MHRSILACLLIAAGTMLSASQQLISSDAPKGTSSGQKSITPMPLVAPLFAEDATTSSIITIISDAPGVINLDVILSDLSGEQVAKNRVAMQPYSQQVLRIRDLLERSPHPRTLSTYGSVTLMPQEHSSLAAQLSISSNDGAFDIEEEFIMLTDSGSAIYRSVAGGLFSPPLVSIMSLSTAEQEVLIDCFANGRTVTHRISIDPKQTVLLKACRTGKLQQFTTLDMEEDSHTSTDDSTNVAISVRSSAPGRELAVFGIGLQKDQSHRTLRAVPFWNINVLKSTTALYTGVPLAYDTAFGSQSFIFRATVGNFSDREKKALVVLAAGNSQESKQRPVAELTVPPNGVFTTELPGLSSQAANGTSIIVQMDGAPGEMLSDIYGYRQSASASVILALPAKDLKQMENGGEHPWIIGDAASSTLLLFNPDLNQNTGSIQLSIYTQHGTWSKKLSLPALATTAVSISDIIQKQQRDEKGRTLPVSDTSGIVTWVNLASTRVFGKLVQLDETNGTSRTFACGNQTYVMDYMWEPDGFYGLPGDSQLIDTVMDWSDGTITYDAAGGVYSDNDNIATIAYDWSSGRWRVSGVSQGQTGIEAYIDEPIDSDGNYGTLPAQAPAAVVVPTYFEAIDAQTIAGGACDPGYQGAFFKVTYQVLDQNGDPLQRAGMTPLELAPGTGGQYLPFTTPPTTASDGTLIDIPVGTCFMVTPQNACVDVSQAFQITSGGSTFSIATSTGRRDCEYGQRLSTTGNPPGKDHTYTQGTVN